MALMLSQDAEELTLVSREGDPIGFSFSAKNVNWAGDYAMHVKATFDGEMLLEVTVTATFNSPNTDFTLVVAKAANTLVAGKYLWDMEQTDGPTRLGGEWIVKPQVTVVNDNSY